MNSAIQISPWALLVGIAAYVLKRWWDQSDALSVERKRMYAEFLAPANRFMHAHAFIDGGDGGEAAYHERVQALQDLKSKLPELSLYGSPQASRAWRSFIAACAQVVGSERMGATPAEADQLKRQVISDFEAMVAIFKADLFGLTPRFWFESIRARRELGVRK